MMEMMNQPDQDELTLRFERGFAPNIFQQHGVEYQQYLFRKTEQEFSRMHKEIMKKLKEEELKKYPRGLFRVDFDAENNINKLQRAEEGQAPGKVSSTELASPKEELETLKEENKQLNYKAHLAEYQMNKTKIEIAYEYS